MLEIDKDTDKELTSFFRLVFNSPQSFRMNADEQIILGFTKEEIDIRLGDSGSATVSKDNWPAFALEYIEANASDEIKTKLIYISNF